MLPEKVWEFGYFGNHHVLMLPKDVIDQSFDQSLVPDFFELQIKTLFQHAWSEANHDLGYKPGNQNLDDDELRQLAFTSAQAWVDEAFWCMRELVEKIPTPISLADMANHVSGDRIPPERDVYKFASVSRIDGRVRPKGETSTSYSAEELQEVREGDLLISGIDLVHGSVGVVGADCDKMVVSKEYFILEAKENVDGHWLASLLRTRAVRRIVEGMVTGTSNRTRVDSADVLMALPLPPAPALSEQNAAGNELREAHRLYGEMIKAIHRAEATAAKSGEFPIEFPETLFDESSVDASLKATEPS